MNNILNFLKQITIRYDIEILEDSPSLRDYFFQIMSSPKVVEIFEELSSKGLLQQILPELVPAVDCSQDNLHHKYDVFHHILYSIKAIPKSEFSLKELEVLEWTMLLHDIGKPHTKKRRFVKTAGKEQDTFYGHAEKSSVLVPSILQRFNMNNEEIFRIQKLVKYHDELINYKLPQDDRVPTNKSFVPITEKTVSQLIGKIGESDFELLMAVIKADNSAQSDYQREQKLKVHDAVIEYGHKIMNKNK